MSMNANVSSVQEVVRDGEKMDLYYYSKHNMFVQARPTLCNNKFKQAFTSYNNGTNQFIFSPDQGLSDVICVFQLRNQADVSGFSGGYLNYGLNRGWGYALIENIAIRYGGSSQFFWTGEQMLLQNAVDMQDAVSRDTLMSLGGEGALGVNPYSTPTPNLNDFTNNQWAYVYLNVPHATPNGDGLKMAPLPTELLRQPVLIQVNLKDAKTIFSANNNVSRILPFDPVKNAYFQVKQVRMVNSEDLLTNEEDPSKITYTYPLKYFAQQQFSVNIPSVDADGSTQINLTGFRNGTVKTILIWLTKNSDINGSVNTINYFNWYAPKSPTLSINGEIFYTAEEYSSLLLDLVNNKQPTNLSTTRINPGAPFDPVEGGFTSTYLKVDFSQHTDPVTGNNLLVAGKSITNSIVNFSCKTPDGQGGWTLKAVYLYNSSLIFAGGNCEYSF